MAQEESLKFEFWGRGHTQRAPHSVLSFVCVGALGVEPEARTLKSS